MEFNRCSRCGSFYVSEGNVCPKCSTKDGFEFSTFQNYIKENGLENSLDTIADDTGISIKNLNRFIEYDEFKKQIIWFAVSLIVMVIVMNLKIYKVHLSMEIQN